MVEYAKRLFFFTGLMSCFYSSSTFGVEKIETQQQSKFVEVNGSHIYMEIHGIDGPVVLFDSGLGDDSSIWKDVILPISKVARVVVYDRPGNGKSQLSGKEAITSEDTVINLQKMLENEQLHPPYILVGHSLGGLNLQLFAQKYPQQIAGIVLVDSMSCFQNIQDPLPKKETNYYREAAGINESKQQVCKTSALFPSVPLIVLSATNHPNDTIERKIIWQKWQKDLVALSSKGFQIIAWESGHAIQKDQPQLVIDAVVTVMVMAGLLKM